MEFKRKRINKELENSNLARGQVSEAQVHEDGFLDLVVHPPKELDLVSFDELEQRDLETVDCLLKRYRKVLKHLFHLYTGTRHVSHNVPELLEDHKKRKETLASMELIQFLKDYGKFYLTSHNEVASMVRDINVRLLNKRGAIQELDFAGFEVFIVQFCFNNMVIPHQITVNTTLVHSPHVPAHTSKM
jgi:hypothetical protein